MTEINGTVYAHSNKVNGKVYVGQTTKEVHRRWHPGYYLCSTRFNAAIKEYGWEGFNHQILQAGIKTREELDRSERAWISHLQATDPEFGYNLRSGGGHGGGVSEESRKKMSASQKRIGNRPPSNLGKKHSSETLLKMSVSAKKRGMPGWVREKGTEDSLASGYTNKGKKHSEESRKNMSLAKKGKLITEDHKLHIKVSMLALRAKQREAARQQFVFTTAP